MDENLNKIEDFIDQPAVVNGHGVPSQRRLVPKAIEANTSKEESQDFVPISESNIDEEYSDTPSIVDQFEKKPDSCLPGAPRCKIFKLNGDGQGEMAYDKFMADTVPLGAPKIVVVSESEQFYEGSWIVKVVYFPVRYKKLVPIKENRK
jgi:hypothetical protein